MRAGKPTEIQGPNVVTHPNVNIVQAHRLLVGVGDLNRENDRRLTFLVDP